MAIYRAQCSFSSDTLFPRDRCTITPHFESTAIIGGSDEEALANDLAVALAAWCSGTREVCVKFYDAQGTPPVLPVGEHTVNPGVQGGAGSPREVAICLSYYSGSNQPRRRGRLYIPFFTVASSTAAPLRPTTPHMTKVGDLVPIFTGLGGTDIDWVVFSRADNDARPVSNWWVDDEFDTVRSRGMRPTSRITGTASE